MPSSPVPRAASARKSPSYSRAKAPRSPSPTSTRRRPMPPPRKSTRPASASSGSPWTSPTKQQVDAGIAEVIKTFGRIDVLISNAGIQIVAPIDRFRVRQVEAAAVDPPRRRVPHHPGGAAPDVQAGQRQRHLHGLGAFEGGLRPQGALCHGQARLDRARQGRRQGRRRARRARQCDLPRLRAHAAGRKADSRAGQGTRHLRAAR